MDRRAKDRPGVLPLKTLCERALMANIGRIRRLGHVPQCLVADVLAQCAADQLELIEHYNPHIVGDNEALWMAHCAAKYKDLADDVARGAGPPGPSWRAVYHDMRRRDKLRAQQIMERVRARTAELGRERDAHKVQVIPALQRAGPRRPAAATSAAAARRGTSLMHHARMEARAHIQMLRPPPSHAHPARRRVLEPAPSPSPAQSPPRYSSTPSCSPPHPSYSPPHPSYSPPHPSYSPPHSSYSPPHPSYSPPHVPDSGAQSGYAPRFNVFEDLMGVSAGPGHHHSSTVIIKEQLRPSATTPAKRKRPESSGDDGGTAAVAAAQGRAGDARPAPPAERRPGRPPRAADHPAPLPRPGTKVRSEDLADPGAEDLFRMLSGLH